MSASTGVRTRRRHGRAAAVVVCLLMLVEAGLVMSSSGAAGADRRPVDSQATPETVALYRSLAALEGRATLFGHQDDLAYGHDWSAVDGRSDVKGVVGA